mgnify:CR=1 FL=1
MFHYLSLPGIFMREYLSIPNNATTLRIRISESKEANSEKRESKERATKNIRMFESLNNLKETMKAGAPCGPDGAWKEHGGRIFRREVTSSKRADTESGGRDRSVLHICSMWCTNMSWGGGVTQYIRTPVRFQIYTDISSIVLQLTHPPSRSPTGTPS